MIQITPQMRILLSVEPADFRKGIDGIAALCRTVLKTNPLSGTVFVFRNRKKTAIKILQYDGQGFWIFQKRLSNGKFQWWPEKSDNQIHPLAAHELLLLIWNGNPAKSGISPDWRSVPN